ncbi:acyl-CoA thioesterase [Jatrophihabitans sp. DSM 45814]
MTQEEMAAAEETPTGVEQLVSLLDVESLGSDLYRANAAATTERRTLFGGQVMAQSLRAAAATTAEGMFPHSLHAYFLRAGLAAEDLYVQVERTRDGRNFCTRQVTARQGDRTLFTMTASFHRGASSAEFQTPAHDVPPPPKAESLSAAAVSQLSTGLDFIDESIPTVLPTRPEYLSWVRSQGALPSDRVLHACIMAYLSDMRANGIAATSIGLVAGGPDRHGAGSVRTTSLDHAMWFHRPGRCDDWLLVNSVPISTSESRGLIRGSLHDRAGTHLASFTQELLIQQDD